MPSSRWEYVYSLLPSVRLSSLPLPLSWPSLPTNIQRRLVTLLLRKSVGNFCIGNLEHGEVEADLARGTVAIGALELDCEVSDSII